MKNNWVRLIAGALASVVLVGAIALTGGMKKGSRTDGLLYQASGIHPDAELLLIDRQTVTAEEYLYWLAYDCEYLSTYVPDVDWSAELTEGLSYGDYAKTDTLETVKLYSVVRAWAEEAGVTLTEEDQAALDAQRLEYVTYYGSEEAYQQQLETQGITEEVYDRINETAYLYQRMQSEFCTEGSALYPDTAALAQYAADNGYPTGKVIYVEAGDGAEEEANGYLKRMQEAEDKIAEHAAICQERQVDQMDSITFAAGDGTSGDALSQAVTALQPSEMTGVVATDDGYYIFLREETDLSAVLPTYFNTLLQARRSEANVVYNEELYAAIDTGTFYTALTQLRSQLGQTPQQAEQ